MADLMQQVRKTLDSVKMPPLIGPLADLPDHVKQVVEAYGRACAREAIAAALLAARPEGFVLVPVERGQMYVCPACKGPGVVTKEVHDATRAARPQEINHD